jgi:hypothetical protein
VTNNIIIISFTFSNINNIIFQLGTILNNEASVLESFLQIFSMAGRYFPVFIWYQFILTPAGTDVTLNTDFGLIYGKIMPGI